MKTQAQWQDKLSNIGSLDELCTDFGLVEKARHSKGKSLGPDDHARVGSVFLQSAMLRLRSMVSSTIPIRMGFGCLNGARDMGVEA